MPLGHLLGYRSPRVSLLLTSSKRHEIRKKTWKWAQNSIPSPTGQKGHLDMGGLLLKTIAFVENYYYETFSLLCLSAVISHKKNCWLHSSSAAVQYVIILNINFAHGNLPWFLSSFAIFRSSFIVNFHRSTSRKNFRNTSALVSRLFQNFFRD